MPIYEYRCEQGHTFEVMRRIDDDAVSSCQTCSAPVQRVFRPVAVHFKGSGFYSTDYGSRKRARELKDAAEGNGKHSKDGEGSGKSDGQSSEGKSGSTSEGKSEGSSSDSKSGSDKGAGKSSAASSASKSSG